MRTLLLLITCTLSCTLYATESSTRILLEKKILHLSVRLNAELMHLSRYENLASFCNDRRYRATIFDMLDQIHTYHDMLEVELKETTYNHSRRTISRILRHIDKLDKKFNPTDFTGFFREQCSFQNRIEKHAAHYKAGFSTHSYHGQVYAQEVVMYRYLKRLTRRVARIRKHVEHFYIRRKVWEH